MRIITAIILSIIVIASCTPSQTAALKSAGHNAVECATSQIGSLVSDFGPLLENRLIGAADSQGKIGADALRDAGKSFVTNEAKCVFATTVASLLAGKSTTPNAPQSAVVQLDSATLRANFNVVRAESLDGATFHTAAGTL